MNIFSRLFYIYFTLNIFAFLQAETDPQEYVIIPEQALTPILSPDLSERKTLKIRLSNQLEAYLISDPKADKSGAVLSVAAGSWDDPVEYPGLAHFLEHMLFLGTKKYPDESSYQRFIAENGGLTNAFTAATQTSFLFSINNDAFKEGLDRFSQFFKEPLFNPSGVARELHAIDQEYATHLDNDDMRLFMMDKELANPKHPYHNFSMGNSHTLSQVSQKTLKQWYQQHYSANLMRLIVYSPLPLEELRDLVIEDFKGIINSKREHNNPQELMNLPKKDPALIYVDAIKNSRTLEIIWDLPTNLSTALDYNPAALLCYILGHEGEQSLLAQLKRSKLADKLQCSFFKLSPETESIFLEIELTDEGLEHTNDVINYVFQTLAMIKKEGFPTYLFNEIQSMDALNYNYQSRQEAFSFMMTHASWGFNEDLSTYPEKTSIVQKFDPNLIKELINTLTPQLARFYILAPSLVTEIKTNQTAKWMDIKYTSIPIPKEVIQKWEYAEASSTITLPAPNPFIPEKLSTKTTVSTPASLPLTKLTIPKPITILDDKKGKVYYAKDDIYLMPKVAILFTLISPDVEMGSAAKTVLADLYVKALTESLKNTSYPAGLAGLEYEIKRQHYGIEFQLQGYNEKAEMFFNELIKQIKQVQTSEAQFEIYRQAMRREYQNFSKQSPLDQAIEYLKVVLYRKFTTEKQKISAINRISYEKFNEYTKNIFSELYVQGLFYGALEQQAAKTMVDKLLQEIDGKAYPKGEFRRPEVIRLSESQGPFFWEVTTKAQGNAVCLAIEYPGFSFKERAAQQILMRGIEQPFFATLRTKQQTGYIVYSSDREIEKQLFNFFAIQSSTHAARDLLSRFELFIEGFLQEITEEIPEPCFNKIKQSVLEELQTPVRNIKEMAILLQGLAFDYKGDFNWLSKRIEGLKELNYVEFLKLAHDNLGKANNRRSAILLKGAESEEKVFQYNSIGNILRLRKASIYTTPEK